MCFKTKFNLPQAQVTVDDFVCILLRPYGLLDPKDF
jgi:hypothetical protein